MKKILAFLVVIAMIVGLVACDKPAEPSKSPSAPATTSVTPAAEVTGNPADYPVIPFLAKYAKYKYDKPMNALYLVCTTAAEYFPNSYAVWKPLLAAANINMDMMGPPEYADASLISLLETQLQSGKYDIVVLYPITPGAITPLLDGIWNDYHIPILAYAFAPETGCGHYYLGTSYYQAGVVLANSIIKYVDDNKAYFSTLKQIKVAFFMSPPAVVQYQRVKAVRDTLAKDARFKLMDDISANGVDQCLKATETLLTSDPDVEIIVNQIDSNIPGVMQALNSGNYKHSDYLSTWGFDATGVVLNYEKTDGVKGHVQGSSFIDHKQAGEALKEIIPILVGAAKQKVKVAFTEEEQKWLGTACGNWYHTVVPSEVDKYYTPKK